jgi:hypothetical protein
MADRIMLDDGTGARLLEMKEDAVLRPSVPCFIIVRNDKYIDLEVRQHFAVPM